jgi:hypothetical protein
VKQERALPKTIFYNSTSGDGPAFRFNEPQLALYVAYWSRKPQAIPAFIEVAVAETRC